MVQKNRGFTLVELAIALMVIGLLIGGVLKGQELIKNAELMRAIRDISDYKTATSIFETSYNALPGDIRNPGTRIPNCSDAMCIFSGNGDRNITNYQESGNFTYHLEKAGMLSGSNVKITAYWGAPDARYFALFDDALWMSPEYPPRSMYNQLRIGTNAATNPVKKTFGEGLDMKLDDGNPRAGSIAANSSCVPAGTTYAAWVNSSACELYIDIDGVTNPRNGGPVF